MVPQQSQEHVPGRQERAVRHKDLIVFQVAKSRTGDTHLVCCGQERLGRSPERGSGGLWARERGRERGELWPYLAMCIVLCAGLAMGNDTSPQCVKRAIDKNRASASGPDSGRDVRESGDAARAAGGRARCDKNFLYYCPYGLAYASRRGNSSTSGAVMVCLSSESLTL